MRKSHARFSLNSDSFFVLSNELYSLPSCRQQHLLKQLVEVKPKKPRLSDAATPTSTKTEVDFNKEQEQSNKADGQNEVENPVKSLLGLAYATSSDDEDSR